MRIISAPALTFDDVSLVPAHSTVLGQDVALATRLTRTIELSIPLVSAAMDTVTEARLAIALAQEGGIGIIHKSMPIAEQAAEVRQVKKFESGMVTDPITVTPGASVQELIALTQAHGISGLPVVEGETLLGIVTHRDFRFETQLQRPVSEIMTPKDKLITVPVGTAQAEVVELMHAHRLEKVLVVDDDFALRGLITVKDIQNAKAKPCALKDHHGQLLVGAAVGTSSETDERVAALVAAGVDVLVVDTAHGHSAGVIERVKRIKQLYTDVQVIAGNIVTGDAARALVDAGADAVKVGVGPGSICTTRIVAGVGVPQITAIDDVVMALKGSAIPVIADGGIRHSGDIVKALAAGADAVMVGGLFAGTEEAPGEVELYQGRSYKSYRGMGSVGAMAKTYGSRDRYFQDTKSAVEELVPQGIEGRVPYKGSLLAIVHQLVGGIRAGLGYVGCPDVQTLHAEAQFVRVTGAGARESHVHDVMITKEPPNYSID